MTPRERVECALRGERPDRIPFTVYDDLLPRCETERNLRNAGACVVVRHQGVCSAHSPNVQFEGIIFGKRKFSIGPGQI